MKLEETFLRIDDCMYLLYEFLTDTIILECYKSQATDWVG